MPARPRNRVILIYSKGVPGQPRIIYKAKEPFVSFLTGGQIWVAHLLDNRFRSILD